MPDLDTLEKLAAAAGTLIGGIGALFAGFAAIAALSIQKGRRDD